MSVVQSLCKFTGRVTNVGDIGNFRKNLEFYCIRKSCFSLLVPTLRQAIATAQSDTPGPVFIEFPLDVLQPYQQVVKEAGFITNADTAERVREILHNFTIM
jgi:acetolactate synthase-like protein